MNRHRGQRALNWPAEPSYALEDFLLRPGNQPALQAVLAWDAWPVPVFLLSGAPMSGKTHLGEIWRTQTGAERVSALKTSQSPLLLEDASEVAQKNEPAFFRFLNQRLAGDAPLLLTSRQPSSAWPIGLPDLASRLRALPHARLETPDDGLLQAMMVKWLRDAHVDVKPQAIQYVLGQIERSPEAAQQATRLLAATASEQGRAVNLALARTLFPKLP